MLGRIAKYSAFVTFKDGKNYMEFSNSINRLQKLILIENVTTVVIEEEKRDKPEKRKLFILTKLKVK